MTPESLISKNIKLVSLPEVCLRLQEISESPTATAEQAGQVIATDSALTARLLQLVNSAYYGINAQIDTLPRAISLVGMRELKNLAYAASTARMFTEISDEHININGFWQHSVYCGIVGKHLAKYCNILHSERLFTAGLLHDIGSLLIAMLLPDETRQITTEYQKSERDLHQIEEDILDFNHAELGATLLNSWNLPRNLCAAILYHHVPAEAHDAHLESAILHIANIISEYAQGFKQHPELRLFDPFESLLNSDIHAETIAATAIKQIDKSALMLTTISEIQIFEAIRFAATGFDQIMGIIYPTAMTEMT